MKADSCKPSCPSPSPCTSIGPELAELIDSFGPLRLQVEQFAPIKNQAESIWKRIRPHLSQYPNNKPVVLTGNKYEITLGICALDHQVKPSMLERVKKLFGAKRFRELAAAAFPLGVLEEKTKVDGLNIADFVEESQTGSRRITSVVEIEAPQTA
jgi:hypothetical protein